MNLTASREKEEDKMLEEAGEKRMEEPEGEGGKGRVEKGKEEEKEDEDKEDDEDEDNESEEEEETTGKLCKLQFLPSSALVNSGNRWFILGHPCSLQSSGFPSNFTYSLCQKSLNWADGYLSIIQQATVSSREKSYCFCRMLKMKTKKNPTSFFRRELF